MPDVLRFNDIDDRNIAELLNRYHLNIQLVDNKTAIPGSFWGEQEAGLIKDKLYLRADTPVHSALHESCHYVCMDDHRRQQLNSNAGGSTDEENAVCYLQILLAEELSCMGKTRMFHDMDCWGYSFRLGSAKAWFEADADDAREWLLQYHLIDAQLHPTFRCRGN